MLIFVQLQSLFGCGFKRKMSAKKPLTIFVAAVAILLAVDLPDEPLLVSHVVTLPGNVSAVFDNVRRVDKLPLLFPWFDDVYPVDDRPWGKGKLFKTDTEYGVFGRSNSQLRVVDYAENAKLEFEGDMYLLPRVKCTFQETRSSPPQTTVDINVFSRRRSAFFQLIMRPIFRFVLYFQQRQKLFMLQYAF